MMPRTTISISSELKRKLSALKREKTWDEFLSELLNSVLSSEIRDLEDFLRKTSGERDIPFERVKIRLRGEDGGGTG